MFIENPTNGDKAGVTSANRLKASCVTVSSAHEVNHSTGDAYSFRIDETPTGALDCVGYIKNNSDSDMVIDMIIAGAASDETIIVKLGDSGTTSGGAAATLTNLNAGSGNIADVTAETGSDITGLSGGSTAMGFFVKGGESSKQFQIPSSFIIPKNKIISFYAKTGGIAVLTGALITFHNENE